MQTKTGHLKISILLWIVLVISITDSTTELKGQNVLDSLTEKQKSSILHKLKNFSLGFYVDSYYNMTFGGKKDTSNLVPFSSNCPIQNQIRLNIAAFELAYQAEKARGKFILQYGDAPNLLEAPEQQFIKNIRQANIGFRIIPGLWIDFGYLLNPVGYESSWPVINQLSTVTIGGYYEPGSVLGVKLSYKFSEKCSGAIMFGNPYSLAYSKNTNASAMLCFTYQPISELSITYNNLFGNQALVDANINNNLLYNNLITKFSPAKFLTLVGELDVAFQTNSRMAPDTTKIAFMTSSFIQAQFFINQYFTASIRGEVLNDPNGFLTKKYSYNGKIRGLKTAGLTVGAEYRPISSGYIRLEYRYIHANSGNKVFYSKTSDYMEGLILTTGLRL